MRFKAKSGKFGTQRKVGRILARGSAQVLCTVVRENGTVDEEPGGASST